MPGFRQIIEYTSSRPDEVTALADQMRAQREAGTVQRVTMTTDRERPGHYLTVVEFDSYEEAMENSNRPETQDFAAKMAVLCDEPPTFRNLDVVETWQAGD